MWFVATITLRRFVAGSGRRPPLAANRATACGIRIDGTDLAVQGQIHLGYLGEGLFDPTDLLEKWA